jgi:lysophospholipase L1-like esterase
MGISLIAMGVLTAMLEIALRSAGERPDNRTPQFRNCFFTDDDGIFRATAGCPELGPVNSAGFPGGEFVPDGRTPSVLILGDSFAWGASARPRAPSFADHLVQAGWNVFNTGIPGTSTNQYAKIAAQSIPRLKPSVVAVFFFLGNDFQRPPLRPGQNLWYVTDQYVWLYGFSPEGEPLAPAEAYRRWQGLQLGGLRHRTTDLLRRSVVGTRIYRAMQRLAKGGRSSRTRPADADGCPATNGAAATLADVRSIQAAAAAHAARFQLFVIPPRNLAGRPAGEIPCLSVLQEFHPLWPSDLTADDYTNGPTPHFTAEGHRRFAHFVLEALGRNGAS